MGAVVSKFKTPAAIPQWLRDLPADSLLNSRDVAATFGFTRARCVASAVHCGSFPPADFPALAANHHEWKAITIRNEIRRRAKLNAERTKP